MNIKKTIYNRLKNLTSQKFNDSSSIFDIGIDSLDLVELVTDAEEELNVAITDEQLQSFKTVGDVIKGFEKVAN